MTFGVFEVLAHEATSERSILDEETLEGTLCGTPQAHKVVFSGTPFTIPPHRQST